MTSDELKSAEKRAEDAAIEKENMRVAMTAQEERAISTTFVHIIPSNPKLILIACNAVNAKLRRLHTHKLRLDPPMNR